MYTDVWLTMNLVYWVDLCTGMGNLTKGKLTIALKLATFNAGNFLVHGDIF